DRLDGGVAQPHVVARSEDIDELVEQLPARGERDRCGDRLLAHAPVVVAERPKHEPRRPGRRIRRPLEQGRGRLAPLLGIVRCEQALEIARVHQETSSAAGASASSCSARNDSVSTSKRPTSSTNTSEPPLAATPTTPRASSPAPSVGGARSSPVYPNTPVTRSTVSPTLRPSTSIRIHLVRRDGGTGGRPKRTRRSTIGTTSPRWSITPATDGGAWGSSVSGTGFTISRTDPMGTA